MTTQLLTSLIVEDNPAWRRTLVRLHEEASHEIKTATNFKEALSLALKIKPFLIVTDIRLVDDDPLNVDGIRLLSILRDNNILKNCIVITGYSDPSTKHAAEELGAVYLEKGSFSRDQYLNELKKAHSSSSIYNRHCSSIKEFYQHLLKCFKKICRPHIYNDNISLFLS